MRSVELMMKMLKRPASTQECSSDEELNPLLALLFGQHSCVFILFANHFSSDGTIGPHRQ
ncbi:hypothetical protein BS297_24665 [Rhodococcus erythropolis]|uniref:Uncharacterized protein n=1 Tax=Rhodococcus erythropolis TaxID=1833 RepID=A0A0C2VHJ1_RHOER|nr:hypothetical protein BS297_24665 [Rhodococcus erythropolis]KIM14333.1 hypothetical protein QV65_32845 [Rhodococcus erythropolis]